jgi:Putative inner membrane protein (DUF1819)
MKPPNQEAPYLMSFGTGGLYVNESALIAGLYRPGDDWCVTAAAALQSGAFPVRKESSARRTIREITNRLRCLSADELEMLHTGGRSEQTALLWLAACRAYRFVGEFAVQILNERYLSFRTEISYDDFDHFYAAKAEWSSRLAGLSALSRAKLRAVMFRMMREADIVLPANRLLGTVLPSRIHEMISRRNPDEFQFFPGAQRQAEHS